MEGQVGLRERKKDRLRYALFASALRQFQQTGFTATSIDDIADSVDVSRKTFFRYFKSKEDVVVIDEERKVAIVEHALRERAANETVPAAVGRALRELASYYAAEPEIVRALYRLGSTEPVLAHRLLEHHAMWQQAVARSIAASLAVDPATDIRPHVIAAAALAAARLGLTEWVGRDCAGTPEEGILRQFDSVRPALEMLAVQQPSKSRRRGRSSAQTRSDLAITGERDR